MKRFLNRSIFCALALTSLSPVYAAEKIDIDPPHWWVGMQDSSLQLQIHADGIRDAKLDFNYPGVTLDSIARLDLSPNWQYVYLTVSPETKPGKINLKWTDGKKKYSAKYELRRREPNKGANGFTAADVLYLVMPDRFSDGDSSNNNVKSLRYPVGADRSRVNGRHGGDIQGMINHIDYIDSLGVTAVWVNPVLENDIHGGSYHGYATTDYYAIDPRFGTNDDYARMISMLHDRGIKTVMDMIFNHSGSTHPWVLDPPSSDWLNNHNKYIQTSYRLSTYQDPYATDYDKFLTTDGWFTQGMPDLNQRNPHLMKYLIQNSIWWIEEAGIDGIRMDTYPYADAKEMARWISAVEKEYPKATIVGECWYLDPASESYWQRGSALAKKLGTDNNLPVVMDFGFMDISKDLKPFTAETDPWNGLNKIYDHFAGDFVYADPMKVLRFLDNHDTERVITKDIDSLDAWKQAMTVLLTVPGIPQIYYGTELLMSGTRQGGDGNVRKDMPGGFPGDSINAFSREGRTPLQNEAFDFLSTLNKWRRTSKAISEGSMKHFMPTNGLYLYERAAGDNKAVVILNGVDRDNEVDMTRYMEIIPAGSKWKDILTGEVIEIIPETKMRTFAPRETRILIPAE